MFASKAGAYPKGVGKTTSLLSAHFGWVFIAIKWKNRGN
jgi:hypothetical protein